MKEKQDFLSEQIMSVQDQIEENFTDSLLKLSYKYLDQYYLQARQQSNRSFWITVGFSVLGGAVLLSGVVGLVFFQSGTEGYLTVSAGLITNLISAVFFYLYNRSARQMQSYYDRLVLAQNLAVAVKAAELLPQEAQTKQLGAIIDQLILDYNKNLFIDHAEKSNSEFSPRQNTEKAGMPSL